MDLKEIGINTRNWIVSAQDRDYWRGPFECGIEPPDFINHGTSCYYCYYYYYYYYYYYEELHSLYRSPNIVRMIKSRRLRWAGHIARMEEIGVLSKF